LTGIFTLGALGLSLSVDAFAAAVGKGAVMRRPRLSEALRIGMIFGLTEAISPAIGWAVGRALTGWIMAIGNWVAFALLLAVGGHMLWMALKGFRHGNDAADEQEEAEEAPKSRFGGARLLLTAVATSIDAMAVGVSLAVLDVGIGLACLVIGAVTTVIATCGVVIGRHAGERLGPLPELLGGGALIAIGVAVVA